MNDERGDAGGLDGLRDSGADGPETEVVEDHLGPGYEARSLPLRGGRRATLVRCRARAGAARRGAVLYVHGFVDYFFQTHVAERFADAGYDFYALDLRGYGRSLTDADVPYFVTDLREYDEELDLAWQLVAADGHQRVVLMAHSTGGLVQPLWLARRPDVRPAALVLNSPFFDLAGTALDRTVHTWAVHLLGRVAPRAVVPRELGSVYGESLHVDHHGEWIYDVGWKPMAGIPVLAGWLSAVRRGHARLHRGLGLDVPVLVMRSAASALDLPAWSERAMRADTVLDVTHMAKWAPRLGPHVTELVVPGGMHELFLSAPGVRAQVFAGMERWLADDVGLPGFDVPEGSP